MNLNIIKISFWMVLLFARTNVCFSQSNNFTNYDKFPFIKETCATEPVRTDPDDPALWIHPYEPSLSLIIATDKVVKTGGLYIFDLDGKILQHIDNIDRPNNVDVEYNFKINETYAIDLAVLTERPQGRLRIFSIDADRRQLFEITGPKTKVFTESSGNQAAPMGLSLYKRMYDGKIFAIVSRKSGPKRNYLGQYELIWNGYTIDLKFIRYFGDCQGREIESIVVDDQLGHVYYSDELFGIRKYNVDPSTNQTEQIGFISTKNIWVGDSEGLALYTTSNEHGYLIATDQIKGGSVFHIYERQGNNIYIKSIRTGADNTDGIEATNKALNRHYPQGLLIVMNAKAKNFLLYDWRNIENELVIVKNHFYYMSINVWFFILESCTLFWGVW